MPSHFNFDGRQSCQPSTKTNIVHIIPLILQYFRQYEQLQQSGWRLYGSVGQMQIYGGCNCFRLHVRVRDELPMMMQRHKRKSRTIQTSHLTLFHLCARMFTVFRYETTIVEGNVVKPVSTKMQFRTERKVPKVNL